MLRSRRFALAAAAVLMGLSACGDAASTTTAGKTPTVIHVGAGANSAGSKVAAGEADRMMMPYQDITYVYDGAFPDLGATGPSWTLPAGATVDEATVARLAKVLGVAGEVRALPADQGGGFMVGAPDYSTATLTVSADGMSSWWYSPAPTSAPTTSACVSGSGSSSGVDVAAPDAPVDSAVVDPAAPPVEPMPCDVPEPPANVPGKDEALAKAKQLFGDLGLDAAQYEYEVYADEWGANVQAYRVLGGRRSPLVSSVGYGAEGALTWASGMLAEPQPAADYPLVSGEAALQRLNDQTGQWSWYGGPGIMAKGGVATDIAGSEVVPAGANTVGVATEPAIAPPDTGDAVTDDPVVIDPVPVESLPAPEPVTVHLTSMRLDLTMVWADDGTIWLLPAYTFTSTDGGIFTIIAVDESFLDTPDPAPVETVPVDTVPVETVVVTTPVVTLPVNPESSVPVTSEGVVVPETVPASNG